MQNKLTVLMPSYNRGQYICEAVASVLNQKTHFGIKLIITDDCSTDGSVEIIQKLQKQYPDKIEIILSDKNERLLANILKAQVRVQTEYFCVLDPDDYYTDENFLQKAVDYLESHPDFSIYSSNCLMLYDDQTTQPYIKTKIRKAVFSFDDLLQDKAIITQTAGSVFRNSVYKNGVPEIIKNAVETLSEASFREDTCRYIIHLNIGSAFFKNEIVAVYRIHNNGIWSGVNDFVKNVRSCKQFYDLAVYFNHKFDGYFITRSFFYAKFCLHILYDLIEDYDLDNIADKTHLDLLFLTIKEAFPYRSKSGTVLYSGKRNMFKMIIKYCLPYGIVRFIQSRNR